MERVKLLKITAVKCKNDFVNSGFTFKDSDESQIKIYNPFFNYVYEQIEELRNTDKLLAS